jgi:hypothetical protein
MMNRSSLNLLGKRDVVWNWVAKGLSPIQIAGREDGIITLIGVSITLFAWVAHSRDIRMHSHLCM